MITKNEKKTIVRAVGKPYTIRIFDWLQKKGITKPDGEPYSTNNISHVLNGLRENLILENHIIDCAAHFVEKAKKEQQKKEKTLLSIKKSV